MVGSRRISLATCLVGATAFGVAMALLKGDDPGVRGAVGNLSAPWLLVGFVPALGMTSLRRGALVGLGSTLVALTGFYATVTLVLAGHLHGGGYPRELAVELTANRVYYVAGTVTGLLVGAAGAWVGRRHRRTVPLLVGLLLAGEVVVVAVVQGHRLLPPPLYFTWGVTDWRPYVVECVTGVAVLAVALTRGRAAGPARR